LSSWTSNFILFFLKSNFFINRALTGQWYIVKFQSLYFWTFSTNLWLFSERFDIFFSLLYFFDIFFWLIFFLYLYIYIYIYCILYFFYIGIQKWLTTSTTEILTDIRRQKAVGVKLGGSVGMVVIEPTVKDDSFQFVIQAQ